MHDTGIANTVPRRVKYPRNLVPVHRVVLWLGKGVDCASAGRTRTKSVTFGQRKRHECIFMGINHATIKSSARTTQVIWKKITTITRFVCLRCVNGGGGTENGTRGAINLSLDNSFVRGKRERYNVIRQRAARPEYEERVTNA